MTRCLTPRIPSGSLPAAAAAAAALAAAWAGWRGEDER